MKNFLKILIGFSVLAVLWGCETEVNVTQPTIVIGTDSPKVLDTLDISVIEFADIDGERVAADYFEWTILDDSERVVYSGFENSKDISWIPDSAGAFIVSVKIGYDGNKTITSLKEITVNESPGSLQQKLVGNWTGTGEIWFGVTWKIDITFTENGHYIATAYDTSEPFYFLSPFWDGYKEVTNPNGGIMMVSPSADIPCQSFIIDEIIDNKGNGINSIGHEVAIEGQAYYYDCNLNFDIQNLSFSNGGNNLYFTLMDYGFENNDWYLRYNLERVN